MIWWGFPGQSSDLRLGAPNVWSLVGEVGSCMPHGAAKNKNKKIFKDIYFIKKKNTMLLVTAA